MSGLPHQSINRCRRQPTLHTQPLPVLGRETSPGLVAGGSGGHRFCRSRNSAWIPALGMECHCAAGE